MAPGPTRLDSTPARVSNNMTLARQTPKRDFGDRMKAGLDTAAGITPGSVAQVFKDLLAGLSDFEIYLRSKGAASKPGMPAVLSDIGQLKVQAAKLSRHGKLP